MLYCEKQDEKVNYVVYTVVNKHNNMIVYNMMIMMMIMMQHLLLRPAILSFNC